jgi:hypothetical protein
MHHRYLPIYLVLLIREVQYWACLKMSLKTDSLETRFFVSLSKALFYNGLNDSRGKDEHSMGCLPT